MKPPMYDESKETPEQDRLERRAGIKENSVRDRTLGTSKSKFNALAKKMATRKI